MEMNSFVIVEILHILYTFIPGFLSSNVFAGVTLSEIWENQRNTNNCFIFSPLNTKRRLLYLKIQFVPRSKHFSSRL